MSPNGTDVVVLDKSGAHRLAGGHPWVYRSDVLALPDAPGFYPVQSKKGRRLGWCAANPHSLISVRLVHRDDAPVTEATLLERLHAALDLRDRLAIDGDAYRLIHAEADGLPGLIVDRYAGILVLRNGCAAVEPHLPALVDALVARLAPDGVLARLDDPLRDREGLARTVAVLHGRVPDEVVCREGEIRYLVAPREGQKTGGFLDQRDNHARLARAAAELPPGRALDAFCYQGGFGLALARVATEVELLDSSAPALDRALTNAGLNGLSNVAAVRADAFDRLRELERVGTRFAAISLDPPAFAKRRRDTDNAYGAYKELNLRAMALLGRGGVLGTSSCSFHLSQAQFDRMLGEAAADLGRGFRVLGRWGAAPDHPERLGFPESRYLKFVMLEALD